MDVLDIVKFSHNTASAIVEQVEKDRVFSHGNVTELIQTEVIKFLDQHKVEIKRIYAPHHR